MDFANFTLPFYLDERMFPPERTLNLQAFKNAPEGQAPVAYEELQREFCRLLGQPYPIKDMTFAASWMVFRVGF
jgi:hypothetical protein